MAKNDIKIIRGGGDVVQVRVDDRTTSSDTQILPGDPVKKAGNFVAHLATGEPTNAAPLYGIAVDESTETSTVDGVVNIQRVIPGETVLRAKVTTPANMDTDAKLLGILNDAVTFDLTSTTYTVDEDEGDDPDVHGIVILGGDIDNGTVDLMVKEFATEQGGTV
jgi:hypothetical protein